MDPGAVANCVRLRNELIAFVAEFERFCGRKPESVAVWADEYDKLTPQTYAVLAAEFEPKGIKIKRSPRNRPKGK